MKKIEEGTTLAAIVEVLAKHDEYALLVVRGRGDRDGKAFADPVEQYANT